MFSGAAAFDVSSMNLTGLGDPQRVRSATVTGAFFSVLGVTPRLGRTLQNADVDESRQVIVLSDGMWRRQFGGRSDVVGSVLRLDGKPFEIVGVAQPELTSGVTRPLQGQQQKALSEMLGQRYHLNPDVRYEDLRKAINLDDPDPECDLDYVPLAAREAKVHTALCNCIGFGSKNSALVVRRV